MPKKTKKPKLPLSIYRNIIETMTKASRAYHKIIKENKKLNIATPFSLQGKIYFLLPDGKIILK